MADRAGDGRNVCRLLVGAAQQPREAGRAQAAPHVGHLGARASQRVDAGTGPADASRADAREIRLVHAREECVVKVWILCVFINRRRGGPDCKQA